MTRELQEAVERLYSVFSTYGPVHEMEFCPCGCTNPDAIEPLLHRSVRSMGFAELMDYSFRAMTTQGSVQNFKSFLPRLLARDCVRRVSI